MPVLLRNPVRNYAWGSPSVIPDFLGVPPTGEPQAELWLGAHPGAPSVVSGGGTTLAEFIEKDPDGTLGSPVLEAFGARLPYLLKILAIDQPLSLQVHPSAALAEEGFARENAAGVAIDAPQRSYRDPWHKPELLLALDEVEALIGFRTCDEAANLLNELAGLMRAGADSLGSELAVAELAGAADELQADGVAGLARIVRRWLTMPAEDAAQLVGPVAAAAALGPIHRLGVAYPGDRGVLVALLLEPVRLSPGEAVFIPAGVPHVYLSGVATEIQACSDNTLRAGLSIKHVDVPEVLKALRLATDENPRCLPTQVSDAVAVYRPGIPEFALTRLDIDGAPLSWEGVGPRIVLVDEGLVQVTGVSGSLELRRGQAAFVPASDGVLRLDGAGRALVASAGLPDGPPAPTSASPSPRPLR